MPQSSAREPASTSRRTRARHSQGTSPSPDGRGPSEPPFTHLFQNTRDIIYRYRLEPTRGFDFVSPSCADIVGYTPEEHYADPDLGFKVVHPEDLDVLRSIITEGGPAEPVVLRWIRKDGRTIWVEQQNVPVYDDCGRLVAIEGIARDASDRRRAEERLRESEERYRRLLETSPDPVVVHDGETVELVNAACLRLLGAVSPDELIGRSIFEFIHRDFHQLTRRRVRKMKRDGSPAPAVELKLVRLDGTTVDIESSASAVMHRGRKLVQAVLRDISERKQSQQALDASEKRFRALIENGLDMVALVRDGVIIYASPSTTRTLGYELGDFVGHPASDFVHPDDLPEIEALYRARSKERPVRLQFRVRHRNSSWRWVEAVGTDLTEEPAIQAYVFNYRDITERKKAEEALRRSEENLRALIENAQDIITVLNPDGAMSFNSPAVENVLGYRPSELAGKNAFDFIHPDDRPHVFERFLRALRGEERAPDDETEPFVEFRFRHKDGSWRFLESVGTRHVDEDGSVSIVVNSRDIEDRKRAEEMVRQMAYHDALTGLPNRAYFIDRLTQALAGARSQRSRLAVLFMDLDRFKLINDSIGHAGGDELLRQVADELRQLVRDGDIVSRVGGDEFTILVREIAELREAIAVGERIIQALNRPRLLNGQEFHITASVGITLSPDDGTDAETLLRNADTAMYRAKENGRNTYQMYAGFMNDELVRRVSLENDLRRSIKRGDLTVFYQPQADVRTGRIVGVEALVRWRHPQRGLMAPDDFIPMAEETGLIIPLGRHVLLEACRRAAEWERRGLKLKRIAVNLSTRQLHDPEAVSMIGRALNEAGLPPERLELEITEGAAMGDPERAVRTLAKLEQTGVRISIDDFGAGYSSLAYLKHLPIHALKIDRAFVRDLTTSPNDAAITSAIIAMAHSLSLRVVAEGVESEQQLEILRRAGCDDYQGYLLSRPRPAEEIEQLLKRSLSAPAGSATAASPSP